MMASLTVIRGHAQMIRRRARRLSGVEAAAMERSADAIDEAARQLVGVMAGITGKMPPGAEKRGE